MAKKPLSLSEIAEKAGYVGGFDEELDAPLPAPPPHIIAATAHRDLGNIWFRERTDRDADGPALFV